MDIIVSHEQGEVPVAVFHIDGDIDSSTSDQFERVAFQEIEGGAHYLLFDLSKVSFMSSAGFRTLTKVFKKLGSQSTDLNEEELHKGITTGTYKSPYLKLFKPSKLVAGTLKIAGFDMFLEEVQGTLQAAVASFHKV